MKKVLFLSVFILAFCYAGFAQNQKPSYEPAGLWKFEAPYAPEGYTTGTMEFVNAEGKYQAFISFTGSDYKIPFEKVSLQKDSVSLTLYVEGNEVFIKLKMENESRISGKALSPEGDIPITAIKTKQ